MNRGWNSRLGFSIQSRDDKTVIVAIYAESVAAKDGRLKIGDQILKVIIILLFLQFINLYSYFSLNTLLKKHLTNKTKLSEIIIYILIIIIYK